MIKLKFKRFKCDDVHLENLFPAHNCLLLRTHSLIVTSWKYNFIIIIIRTVCAHPL